MNRLFFHLYVPDDKSSAQSLLQRLMEKVTFFNHERFEAYWDETLYKAINNVINTAADRNEREDATMRRLLRLKFQDFTDISKLTAPDDGIRYLYGDRDVTREFFGLYAHLFCREACMVFDTDDPLSGGLIHLAYWVNNIQQQPFSIDTGISDIPSLWEWFSEFRNPERFFNDKYEKHHKDEYLKGGEKVSPLNISEARRDNALRRAIGRERGRLFALVKEEGVLVIFSRENRELDGRPVYHGHQIELSNKAELHRLPSEIFKKLRKLYPRTRIL